MDLLQVIKDLLPFTGKYNSTRDLNNESNKLLKKIISKDFESEEDLIKEIYGTKQGAREKYRFLANRALSILSGNVFLKPTERETTWKAVYQECIKKTAVVKLLKTEDGQASANHIAKVTLKKSMKYGITEATKDLSRELLLSAQISGDAKLANRYKSIYTTYSEIHSKEVEAYITLNEVALITSNKMKPGKKKREQLFELLDSVVSIKADSYLLNFRKFKSRIIKANFQNDYNEFAKVYLELKNYSSKLSFTPATGHLFGILNKIAPSLIVSKQYKLANSSIDYCLSLSAGKHNKNITLRHLALLGFHSGNDNLINESIKLANENSSSLPDQLKEWWQITQALFQFTNYIKKSKLDSRFKTSKFLNNLPELSKDKSGANVAIIVIGEFLLRLANKDWDSLIERNEAIRLYSIRNLKEISNKRAKIFFQILRKISRCDFDPIKFALATKAHKTQLSSYPMKIEDLESEIIPYEMLYEMLITALKMQKTTNKSLVKQ